MGLISVREGITQAGGRMHKQTHVSVRCAAHVLGTGMMLRCEVELAFCPLQSWRLHDV